MKKIMAIDNNYKLYSRKWRKDLRKFLSEVEDQLTIVSPYITYKVAKFVTDNLSEGVKITTVTDLDKFSLVGGALEIKALKILEKFSDKSMIVNKRDLHAKIYVADKKRAIITSANLTTSGIDTNHECGIDITTQSVVRQICALIDYYVKKGKNIDVNELNNLVFDVNFAREKQKELKKSNTPEAEKFRKAFKVLDEECKHLYADNNRSATMMFREPICRLLKDGPMTTSELYEGIKRSYSSLCIDDTDYICNGRTYGKVWEHNLRNAQQTMKKAGIIALVNKKWQKSN